MQKGKYMKKLYTIILALALCASLAACGNGSAKNAVIDLGDSERFTQAERQAAVECVLRAFRKWDTPCTVQAVYYDEAGYDAGKEAFYASSFNQGMFGPEDVILLYSDFHTPEGAQAGGFNPDADYTGWKWTLVRDHAKAPWRVIAYGYA